MFIFTDSIIENKFKSSLILNREPYIENALKAFSKRHPKTDTAELRKKLEVEAARIYPMVNRSILKERIKRARYTFWATFISSLIVVGSVIILTGGGAIALVAPALASLVTWGVSVRTIPISYNQRVKGAIDCIVVPYEAEIIKKETSQALENKASLKPEVLTKIPAGNKKKNNMFSWRNLILASQRNYHHASLAV